MAAQTIVRGFSTPRPKRAFSTKFAVTSWTVAAITWLAIISSRVFAADARPIALGDLYSKAEVVLHGTVLAQRSNWERGRIVTRSIVAVDECFKGSCGQMVEIKQWGGSVGDYTMTAHGVRLLELGDKSALFLRGDRLRDLQPVGLQKGVLHTAVNSHPSRTVNDLGKEVSINKRTVRLHKAGALFSELRRLAPAK